MKEKKGFREYVTKVLNGMALGLFSSLIIGLILKEIGEWTHIDYFMQFGKIAQLLMGPAIGAGVAFSIGISPLGIFASIVTGAIGAGTVLIKDGIFMIQMGEPVGALVGAWVGAEVSKLVAGKTKLDIILIPLLTIVSGGIAGTLVGPFIASFMKEIGSIINRATELEPVPMGMVIATLMGMILTLPISSAAIAISLGLNGLAAGAAVVGCSAQMIGFAVSSYKENGLGGAIAQGIGTSMLQVPNIIKNPLIWVPPTLSSAILGPIATTIFKMKNNSIGAGMGTSGLVGQFGTLQAMETEPMSILMGKIILLHFILPAVLTFVIAEYMRRKNWIHDGDMKLNL